MLGTIVNFFAIIGGSILGLLLKGGISERFSQTIMQAISLCVLYIGIENALEVDELIIVIICMCIGSLVGEIIDIDKKLKTLGDKLESRFKNSKSKISEGFVSASLIYCVGAMAIVGSLQSGLLGEHDTLFSKSILDGISAIIFSSTLGIGVMFSAVSVFIYQGLITLGASYINPFLTTTVIHNMQAAGGLIIIGLGLNMLGVTKVKVANMLPAIFLPIAAPYVMKFVELVF